MSERMFPILSFHEFPGSPEEIPWRLLERNSGWAIQNHGQSLERLAQRGGLSPCEALSVIEGRRWENMVDAGTKLRAIVDADTGSAMHAELAALRAENAALKAKCEEAAKRIDELTRTVVRVGGMYDDQVADLTACREEAAQCLARRQDYASRVENLTTQIATLTERNAALEKALERTTTAINAGFGKAQRDHIIAEARAALARNKEGK